nr:LysR family transcriptional regulator [Pseudomonas sp. ICMP 8385]
MSRRRDGLLCFYSARAAQRLGLSPSAMSRALARLRETTGDPLLVRAGRGLVRTFRDRFIGVVRTGHPLSQGPITLARYAAGRHIYVSRRGRERGQIDDALAAQGLTRDVATIVTGFSTDVALAHRTDLIASVPERYTHGLRDDMHSFALPVDVPPFSVAMLWHPRLDADLAHRWLRGCLREVCGA